MTEWISSEQAAEILGVHRSLIPKMRRRGDLTPRPDGRRPPWSRDEVLELKAARAAGAAGRERRRVDPSLPKPPDAVHDWILAPEAAEIVGCSISALKERARVGTQESTVHKGRRWFRRDRLSGAVGGAT